MQTFKYMRDRNIIFLYSIPLLLLLLFFSIKAIYFAYSDFASYYFGSQELLLGKYKEVYDTASLNLIIYSKGFQDLFVSYTPFPPFTSILFAPSTLLPIGISKLLVNSISCLLFAYTLGRSVNYFSIPPFYLVIVPLIFFAPIRSNLLFGQFYLLLFVLLMEGYIAYRKEQIILSSSLWALAIVFKIFPVLILFFLLIKKEYKNLIYISVASAVLLGISVLVNGFSAWQFYLLKIIPRLNNGELNDSYTYIFQSAFMLLKKGFVYNEVLNPNVICNNLYIFWILLALFKAFIFGICVISSLRKNSNDFINFSFWIVASLLISPNGSTYSLILLILPMLALLSTENSLPQKISVLILLTLLCNIPILYFASFPLFLKFPRLYLMIGFFIAMIIITRIKMDFRIIASFVFIFLLMDSSRLIETEDRSTDFFTNNERALIYDYAIANDKLTAFYWNEKGPQQETIAYETKKYSSQDLILKDNQIYYKNIKMTDSPDWKKKPLLINNDYILYLSDKNRGVGFYTLRKLKLS